MKKVLHISFAYGGGVVSAIDSYVNNSSDLQHYLAANTENEFSISGNSVCFEATYNIKLTIMGLLRLYFIVRKLNPDYVHMHSSFAGALGRVIFLFRKGLIYTPHCYSFERNDISNIKKTLYILMESFLTLKPYTLAACSPHELILGERIDLYKKIGIDININKLLINFSATSKVEWVGGANTVVMIGRLCPQKSPEYFARVACLVRSITDLEIEFVWIGDGNDFYKELLNKAGVTVTGWIKSKNVSKILSTSGLYFHSASWEGCPMSLLEAARLKLPIISRKIPSIESIGVRLLGEDEVDSANKIVDFFNGDLCAIKQSQYVNQLCSLENQIKALRTLYA